MEDERLEVFFVVHNGVKRWFRAPRELFILDYVAWRNEFVGLGHALPDLDETDRSGLHIVDRSNADKFLEFLEPYIVQHEALKFEIASRFQIASSAWDVMDILPVAYLDFDRKFVSAFYPGGAKLEKYVPDNWQGIFFDFLTESGPFELAEAEKFWVHKGSDLLKLLNERAGQTSDDHMD